LAVHRSKRSSHTSGILVLSLLIGGCVNSNRPVDSSSLDSETCPSTEVVVNLEQAQLFREAETERATQLLQEIERLHADLETAEAALVEAESGLATTQSRAAAVSSIAVARIQVERAASSAPWRADDIAMARTKLEEAERQVEENRFGVALFFVHRARRAAESILDEADLVQRDGRVQLIQAPRVNLRAGPSTNESILSVLSFGTPVFPRAREGNWVLVQVSGGPVGWIHRRLVGTRFSTESEAPAALRP
jgi:hypothetical protein